MNNTENPDLEAVTGTSSEEDGMNEVMKLAATYAIYKVGWYFSCCLSFFLSDGIAGIGYFLWPSIWCLDGVQRERE